MNELDTAKNKHKAAFKKLSKLYHNPLFILTIITVGITAYLLAVQMKIGVSYWDVFNYLNNALYFAGIGHGSLSYLPPVVPILTSLIFRLGYLSQNVIFVIDGIMFIIGVIGFYLLLNLRFNKIQSMLGSILLISLSIVMPWAVAGDIDVPAMSFSILAIYLTILGVKKNSKYLYLMLIMVIIAVLTRYTSIMLVFPIALYLLIDKNYIKHVKKIGLAILAIAIILTPLAAFFLIKSGHITTLVNLFTSTAFGSSSMADDVAYNPNVFYYLENMLNYISVGPFQGTYTAILSPSHGFPSLLSYVIAIISSIGLLTYLYKIINTKIQVYNKLKSINFVKIAVLTVLVIIFLATFSKVTYILSEILFFGICYITYMLLKNDSIKNLDVDFLFISWFMTYFIFHSILVIKVDRYFITMVPALVYFLILGLTEFLGKFEFKIKRSWLKNWGIYLIIGLIFLSSATATYIGHTPKKSFTVDIGQSCSWIKEHDPAYKNKVIFSDYNPAASWYLKKNVNGAFPRLYKSSNDFSKYLKKNKVDYYIDSLSKPKPDLNGYKIIENINGIAIY